MALLQKRIVSRCNQLGKPVHITRIVDTMVSLAPPHARRRVCVSVCVCSMCVCVHHVVFWVSGAAQMSKPESREA